jgi:hypothetical protein
MIQTETFSLTRRRYLQVLLRLYFRRRWWLWCFFTLAFLIGVIFVNWLFILAPPLTLGCVLLFYWRHAYSKANRIFFRERRFELDNEFLSAYLDDGTTDRVNLRNIIRIDKQADCFLLHIARLLYIYVPFACFKSPADLYEFESIVRSQANLMQK